ncbi:alkaline phosphatase family protein [Balneolaceae bacterium YR4-1]|uniref:Alkaline phosphatase family protein n=1 Tax=Halalkalibaculum roseum TaxID=2709311 RepID=A0A6M1SRU2_9BACT|nr:alkaline phosphatase PafA [Halalkalibaculum roseum]NGP75540.1 alkaline phosphatase family protein [Halalkalibaculum roseum]
MKWSLRLLLFLLLGSITLSAGYAQDSKKDFDPEEQPKLIVGIVVDQMKYDYLTRYWEHYTEDGFKRLVNEGYNFANHHFNYFPTYTGPGHAAIYTGATPSVNGIVGNSWFDRDANRNRYVVEDTSVSTVGGAGAVGQMSPESLLSSTFGDELKKVSSGSKIIGISLKDRGAILPVGHMGNLALWYDDSGGNFVSSTWYTQELPEWVSAFNEQGDARAYSNQTWNTLLPMDQYTNSDPDSSSYEGAFPWEESPVFPHEMAMAQGDSVYWTVKSSPLGNTLVKDLAKRALQNENLGGDESTDLLAISFSSTDYIGHQFGPHSVEIEDTYIRLDRDLADLFATLDEEVGEGNYMVFLTSDHGVVDVPAQLEETGQPGGYFNTNRATQALLNYLTDKYGKQNWIRALSNQQVYLDRELIKQKQIDLEAMQQDIANFLLQFEGVLSTNTAANFATEKYEESLQGMYQRGFQYQRSGDVYIQLKPGWLISSSRTGTTHGSPYTYDTHVPMLMYGWGIPQGGTFKKTVVTQLAPTISELLQIPLPNGSEAKPLIFE